MAVLKRKLLAGKNGNPATTESNLSRNDWINCAIEVLVQEGINQVKIESLALRLGVTKGSFYWHFADRKELLDAMVAQWKEESTQRWANLVASLRGSAISRMHRLFDALGQVNSTIVQNAFRRWGYFNPDIAALVKQSDSRRTQILAELIEELGYSAEEAMFRAEILNFWAIGEVAAGDCLDDAAERVRKAKRLLRILAASNRRTVRKAARSPTSRVLNGD